MQGYSAKYLRHFWGITWKSAQGQGQVTTDLCCEGGRQGHSSVDIRLIVPLSIWAFYEESHEEIAQGQGQEKGRAQLPGLDWKATDNDTQLGFPLRRAAFPGKQADTQGRWSPFSKNLYHLSRKFSTALLHCKRSFELFFQGYFFYFFSFNSTGVRFLNSPPWRACKSS